MITIYCLTNKINSEMKFIYKSKIRALMLLFSLFVLNSCKDEFPGPMDTSSKMIVLNSLRILNAGADGTTVLQGIVDENAKTVIFPRIDPQTDFSKLQFQAEASDGAKLEKDIHSIAFETGESEKYIILKLTNSPRFREYSVRLRLRVPVFGADFESRVTYDFTANPLGAPIYEAFSGAVTRTSGFDGNQILIGHRTAPHLLNVSDLKAGVINKLPLNMTGVPATYSGAFVNGHAYLVNLSGGSDASGLKVFHWANATAAPQTIVDVATVAGAGTTRYGDNFSAALDNQGNGYFFLGNNAGNRVLRFTVANYTNVSDPISFAITGTAAGSWSSFNRIGTSAEYLFTGHQIPISLVSEGGVSSFAMTGTKIPLIASDARIVNFNSERYLIVTTAARTGTNYTNLLVYDITKGDNVKEALTILNNLESINPVFSYSLMGPVNTSPASQTGFYVKKDGAGNDETLMLYSGASDAGFVFFEFGKKVAAEF